MHPALRTLNPFKRRPRDGDYQRYGDDQRYGGYQRRRHQPRRTPYVVLSIGAVLFACAIGFMMWPGASDGYIDSKRLAGQLTSGQLQLDSANVVGSDAASRAVPHRAPVNQSDPMQVTLSAVGQSGNEKAAPNADLRAAIRECANRRLALEQESRAVDRFNPEAVSMLNIEIALYNSQCAVRVEGTVSEPKQAAPAATQPPQTSTPVVSATAKPALRKSREPQARPNAKPPKSESFTEQPANLRPPGTEALAKDVPASKPTQKRPMVSHKPMADPPVDNVAKKEPVGSNPTVMTVQSLLTKRGYQPGPIDGFMGKRTRSAVEAFQRDQNLPVDGIVSIQFLETVLALDGSKSVKGATPRAKPRTQREPAKSAKQATKAEARAQSRPKAAASASQNRAAAPKSLAAMTQFERQTVEWACANRRNRSEAGAYDECIADQLTALAGVVIPNLELLTAFDRKAIDRLCAAPRYQQGLAAYYQCANKQQKSLANVPRKPNINDMSADIREIVKSKCDGLQFTQSLPAYYRCADLQVSQARR